MSLIHKKSVEIAVIIAALAMILLVALVLVIINFGTLGTGFLYSSSCTAQPKFSCSGISYKNLNGNLTLTVSQYTGYNWSNAMFLFVPQNTIRINNVPEISWNKSVSVGNVPNGSFVSLKLPVSGRVPGGTALEGSIWVGYQLTVGGNVQYVEIGTISTHSS